MRARTLAAVLTAGLCLPAVASAQHHRHRHARPAAAGPSASLRVKLQRAGRHGAIIAFAFQISDAGGVAPALTRMEVGLPRGIGIDMRGVPHCTLPTLRSCPKAAQVGEGHLTALMPLGEVTRREPATLTVYKGPTAAHEPTLLFQAIGRHPIVTRLAFQASIRSTRAGSVIAAQIPVEPILPEQPDAALIAMSAKLGTIHAAGRRHPEGITLPRRCPKRGLPFTAAFAFNDGSEATAGATAACPR